MDKVEKISGHQLILLVFTFIIATATLFLPSIVTTNSRQDAWISFSIASLVGVAVVLVVTSVGLRYPKLTLVEYSQVILGKWFGRLVGMTFLVFYIQMTSIVVREVVVTININIMRKSSLEIITIILFIACAFAVKKGLEVITRVNVIVLIATFIAMFICLFLLIKDINLELLTPVLSRGIKPVLKDAVPAAGWFGEVVGIAFILPAINKPKEARACAIWGVVWVAITLIVFMCLNITVFGPDIASILSFPTLELVRSINVLDYIQRIEIIFLVPWMLSNIVKICFFYYVTVLISSRLFKVRDMNTLVLPVGFLIFLLSFALFANNVDLVNFLAVVLGYYAMPLQLGIPLLLMIVEIIRKGGKAC